MQLRRSFGYSEFCIPLGREERERLQSVSHCAEGAFASLPREEPGQKQQGQNSRVYLLDLVEIDEVLNS